MEEETYLSPFMRLPTELRLQIYSLLLPDLPVIETATRLRSWETGWVYYIGQYGDFRVALRHDGQPCSIGILSVSRQIYEEATAYLYSRTFVFAVSAEYISFLRHRYKDKKNGEYLCFRQGYKDLDGFNREFPINKVRKIHVRFDLLPDITFKGRYSPWLASDVDQHMTNLCRLLTELSRPGERLPKLSLELPYCIPSRRSPNGRPVLDGTAPVCIEAALEAMTETLRGVRSCEVVNGEQWVEQYPRIKMFAEELVKAVVLQYARVQPTHEPSGLEQADVGEPLPAEGGPSDNLVKIIGAETVLEIQEGGSPSSFIPNGAGAD